MTKRRNSKVILAAVPTPAPVQPSVPTLPSYIVRKPEVVRLAKPRDLYSIPGRLQVTPDRLSAAIKNLDAGRYEQFADLMNQAQSSDPVVKRAYDIRRSAVAGRKVIIEAPPNVDPSQKQAADDLAGYMQLWYNGLDSPQAFLMRVLDAIGMGISVHELLWGKRSNLWLPTPAPVMTREVRHERDWSVSVRNSQYDWINTQQHPSKFLIHSPYTSLGRPVDQGCFLATMFYWLFKRGGIQFWMSGAERFGNPLILAKMAVAADANQKEQILADLQQLTSDTVGVTTGATEIEIIDAKAAGSTSVWKELLQVLNTEIFLSIGVSPDLLLSGPNGSRSSTETRDGVRLESSKLDAALLWGSIVKDVATWVAYYNMRTFDVPLPIISSVFDDSIPVTRDLIEIGGVTVNEVRKGNGLPAWTREQGGEEIATLASASKALDVPIEQVGIAPKV